jgi:hypothetical protein
VPGLTRLKQENDTLTVTTSEAQEKDKNVKLGQLKKADISNRLLQIFTYCQCIGLDGIEILRFKQEICILNEVQIRATPKEDESDLDFQCQEYLEDDALNLLYRTRKKF